MNITSEQLFTLCRSDRFLCGSSDQLLKSHFDFEGRKPWEIKVVGVAEYLDAIRIDDPEDERKTSWRLLHEHHLPNIEVIASRALSVGTGPAVAAVKKKETDLGEMLCTSSKVQKLAERIGEQFNIDADRLMGESLGEMAYAQLGVVLSVCELVSAIEFPLFTVLWHAYDAGLMPFGVYGWQLDDSYAGPDVLLCIAPGELL